MSKLAFAAENAVKIAGTIDVSKISSTLALTDDVLRRYERLSTNSALVGETLESVIARHSFALPEFNSPLLSTISLAAESLPKFDIASTVLLEARARELAGLNDMVSSAMSSIAFDHLAAFDRSLGRRLVGLSDSYRDIFAGMAAIEIPLPDFVTDLPPRDMIVKSAIVKSRTPDFEPAHAQIDLDDPAYARSDVDLMLADLNVGYVTMLDEAAEVIFGTSLGRVRHGSVSLRELSMHVLHDLAPDDEVMTWTQDPNHYHQGRPTRQARVLYICRHVNYGPYGRYLKRSVNATVAFFDARNGLHEVRPDVCDFQLRLMLTDAIGILRFLLRTASHRS
ncbi:MAG: hypothetical protein ACT4QD_22105 [Acidobacteriota bacterium]